MRTESGLWKHGLLLTLLFGFTVMIEGGVFMYKTRAPIPERVAAPDGSTLFTAADIQSGQDLFRKRGLMDYGSVLGHGAYLGCEGAEMNRTMIRALMASVADTVVFPMQDVLGLGSEARMNTPSVASGNWRWRMTPAQAHNAPRLREMAGLYGRVEA